MGPTWSQIGSKLAQVGVMLGPNWLQVGSSWAMLAPSWLPLKNPPCGNMPHPSSWPQVGSMLAPCWLMLAPCWLMLGQVASKMAPYGSKLAQVGLKMPLCWLKLASRCPKWPPIAKSKNARSGTPWIFKMLKKTLFYRSVCILHFFVSLDAF